jgi:geranylgeranyl pyrophosphate synthase
MLDIEATGKSLELSALENIHRRKTGALIRAAVLAGAHCSPYLQPAELEHFENYANSLGLAFQVIDDVLDIESSTDQLGKQNGADQALNKSTYPSLIGLRASKELAQKLYQQAVASAGSIGDNSVYLVELAALIVNRKH